MSHRDTKQLCTLFTSDASRRRVVSPAVMTRILRPLPEFHSSGGAKNNQVCQRHTNINTYRPIIVCCHRWTEVELSCDKKNLKEKPNNMLHGRQRILLQNSWKRITSGQIGVRGLRPVVEAPLTPFLLAFSIFFSKLNLFLYKDALYGFVVILSKLLLTLYELVSNTQFKYQLRVPVHILQPFNKDSR